MGITYDSSGGYEGSVRRSYSDIGPRQTKNTDIAVTYSMLVTLGAFIAQDDCISTRNRFNTLKLTSSSNVVVIGPEKGFTSNNVQQGLNCLQQ